MLHEVVNFGEAVQRVSDCAVNRCRTGVKGLLQRVIDVIAIDELGEIVWQRFAEVSSGTVEREAFRRASISAARAPSGSRSAARTSRRS